MWATELPQYFADIGARLVVEGNDGRGQRLHYMGPRVARPNGRTRPSDLVRRRDIRVGRMGGRPYTLDIGHDDHGEHFTLQVTPQAPDFRILQTRRDERHLLLYAAGNRQGTGDGAERFLCGHDERHWFVSAVGEPVSTVMAARRALLPRELRHKGLNKTTLTSRANETFKRQGEWFFVPVRDHKMLAALNDLPIHRHEPIQRGVRNKPHQVDELVRFGGRAVYLARGREWSQDEWAALDSKEKSKMGRVDERMRDMAVYIRGAVRHADHATVWLEGWHAVYVNGEIVSSNVTFYD